jgi:hypothetical protein
MATALLRSALRTRTKIHQHPQDTLIQSRAKRESKEPYFGSRQEKFAASSMLPAPA